jgi:hypothetical protein
VEQLLGHSSVLRTRAVTRAALACTWCRKARSPTPVSQNIRVLGATPVSGLWSSVEILDAEWGKEIVIFLVFRTLWDSYHRTYSHFLITY